MPSAAREVAVLEGEISRLEDTAATLRTHKHHFDTLIADHEEHESGSGFFSALTDALEGLVGVIDNGIFGGGDTEEAGGSATGTRKGKDLRSTVKKLQSGGDVTDDDRADTMAHLRQVASDIQARLDTMNGEIDERKARLKAARGEGDPTPAVDDYPPVVTQRDDPARKLDPDEPVVPDTPRPPKPVTPVIPTEPDVPDVIRVVVLPDIPTVVVTPSARDDVTTDVVDPMVVPVHVPDYTPTFDRTEQVEIGELSGEIYDVEELLRSGKTVADLRARDIAAGVLTAFGVGAGALIGGGYPVTDLREAGLDAAALRTEGVTIAALRDAGYGLEELRSVATVEELRTFASAAELHAAGYGVSELHDAFSAADLARLFSVHELKHAGFRIDDLRDSVTMLELRTAYDISELVAAFSVHDLRAAGLPAADLLHAGTSLTALQDAGFSYRDLVGAGASAHELAPLFPHEAAEADGSMSSGGY